MVCKNDIEYVYCLDRGAGALAPRQVRARY